MGEPSLTGSFAAPRAARPYPSQPRAQCGRKQGDRPERG